jgi:hypothetical protein
MLVVAAILFLIPVCLTLFAYIALRYSGNMRLDKAFAEADRLDPGWRFQDIEDARKPYPAPEQNGIDLILRVKAAMPKSMWPSWPFPQLDGDKNYQDEVRRALDESLEGDRMAPTLFDREQERVLRAEVARAKEAIELARQLPAYPYGRYNVKWTKDFISTLLPHVQDARSIGHLMAHDARLRAQDGDMAGALQDAKAVLYASRALGDEETLVSQLVRMACAGAAVRILERSLACGKASDATLLDLQKEFEIEAQTPFFLTGVRGERAWMDQFLENIQKGEISYTQFRRLMAGGFSGVRTSSDDWDTELKTLKCFLNIRNERAQILHHSNMVVEAAKLPSWEMLDAISDLDASLKECGPIWGAIFPALGKVYQADARVKAQLRTAYAALAMERYYLAKGTWPLKLADLVPEYLAQVPLDPYDGAPLKVARHGSALVIYSISQDRKDQGGTLLSNPDLAGSDVGFVLIDPGSRRKPGKPFVFPNREGTIEAPGGETENGGGNGPP